MIPTININPGRVTRAGNIVGGHTSVQATISCLYTGDVQMTDNITTATQILPNYKPGIKTNKVVSLIFL